MSFESEIQRAIFTRLDNGLTIPVYDNVPQNIGGTDNAGFPYVNIGADTHNPWDTDTETGALSTATIHAWSRYRGMTEIKDIQGQIYNLLHRYAMPVNDFYLIDLLFEYSESVLDPDGITRHGIQRFEITVEAIS